MTTKFSQFVEGLSVRTTDLTVGLRAGTNTQFNMSVMADANGAAILGYIGAAGSNVNYLNITNANAAAMPTITAVGTDININLGIGAKGLGCVLFTGTTAIGVPYGTTGQRPSAFLGAVRLNTTTGFYEVSVDGINWIDLAEGGGGLTTIDGTTDQITATTIGSLVTLSLPTTLIAPGTLAAITSVGAPEFLLAGSSSGIISILPQAAAGTYNFNLPITAGTSGYFLTSAGGASSPMTWTNLSGVAVTSINGTTDQITASASVGAVTLSLPNAMIIPGTLTLSADPTTNLEAATKQYVDAIGAGLTFKTSCYAASTANLTATFVNLGGVGDTLTNSGTQLTFAIDGVTPAVGSRILIKNQTTTYQNGIYSVTSAGSGATNWILTRTTDYDTVAEVQQGDFVLIDNGTTQINTAWIQTAVVVTMDVSPITFSLFAASSGSVMTVSASSPLASSGGTSPNITINSSTGSGAVVLATSPSLVTPALGTPSSGNLANCTGYPGAGGVVVQKVTATLTTVATTTSQTFTDTGLTVNITPTSASNKLRVTYSINGGGGSGDQVFFNLVRVLSGTPTNILVGTGSIGSRVACSNSFNYATNANNVVCCSNDFTDNPATTSVLTYKIQFACDTGNAYVNQSGGDNNSASYPRTASTITVEEVTE